MKNKIFLLSALLLATAPLTSCNQGKVTITLDAGIGTFADSSKTKVLTVDRGAKLSSLSIEAPTYEGFATYTWVGPNGLVSLEPNEDIDDMIEIFNSVFLVADYFDDISAMRGYATATVGKSLMDALARQPEMKDKLLDNYLVCITAIKTATDASDAMGIGKVGSGLMDALARQPDARGNLELLSTYCYRRIIECPTKDTRSRVTGGVGKKAMDAVARQPEAFGKIYKAVAIAYSGITVVSNPAKAEGIGNTAEGAVDAIARQPEMADYIINALQLTIEHIINY